MKKFILIAIIAITTALSVSAQPRAIGARFGYGAEVSYQHNLGNNFLELDLGLPAWSGLGVQLTGTYNFVIAQPQWTPGTWTFYAGPGAQFGTYFGLGAFAANIAAVGQVGLSYKFDFPLELSLDMRPALGVAINSSEGATAAGLYFNYL
ncbi:MAG: hypothetical protein K5651_07940, partial [Bacteroidales bacterium]|nr:hypothetical protein [Bacteroidales bacterium]